MFKKNKKLVERVKSLLIVLLSCSAVYLAVRTQLPVALSGAASFGEQRERRTDHPGEPHPGRPAPAYGGDHPGGRGDAALRSAV